MYDGEGIGKAMSKLSALFTSNLVKPSAIAANAK
jgi:hypothetical protein